MDTPLLRRLTAAMSYCGPDHHDVRLDGHVGLGHALLGVAPNPAAEERQPRSLDGRVWIAADARVDGRDDLVARLGARAQSAARDATDAELILHAYDAWGERCVEHLIGDFAFAIWDGARRRLFCARDHFGVVPFYYSEVGGRLLFGNVLRALRLHPGVSDALNDRAIGDFLLLGWNMDHASTAFADVRSLPPAHALVWEQGVTRIRRYWQAAEMPTEIRRDHPEEYVERFRLLFDQAVADRLRSPRAGTHLTGGMDSTSVGATAKRVLGARGGDFELRAYTVVFETLIAEEEGRYAEQVAARIGIPHEKVVADEYMTRPPDGDALLVFPEPGIIPNQSAEYEIARRVATFARSQLAGIGGDPLFYTLPGWPSGPAEWGDRARAALMTLRGGRVPKLGVRTALRRARRAGRPPTPELPDWIAPDFARRADLRARWREIGSEWEATSAPGAMSKPLWANLFAWSHPGANGLPVRSLFPFFDLRLAEHVWATPAYPWRQDKRKQQFA